MATATPSKDRSNTAWPVGCRFDLLDAYMRNPLEVKRVAVKTNEFHVVAEDSSGVRHYAHTDRIASDARYEKTQTIAEDFDDLFGSEEPALPEPSSDFDDLF